MINQNVISLLGNRKSVYELSKDIPLSKDEIIKLIKITINQLPSAFNSQSTRIAILFGEEHSKLWKMVEAKEKEARTPEEFTKLKDRLELFNKSYGTVLFFEDQNVIKETCEKFNVSIERMQQWSHEHQGAATVAIWTTLADNNIGANLQHYIHNIRKEVQETWDIPEHWQLYAQMIFGSIEAPGRDKEKVDIDKRVKVFG